MAKTLNVTVTANDGRKVRMTASQAKAIEGMNDTRKGGCASVVGYRPTTNWVEPPVQDIQFISHFSVENLYRRRHAALKGVTVRDVREKLAEDEVLRDMSKNDLLKLFEERKRKMMDSLETSLSGDRSDAHRQAHDRCYAHIGDIKVHLRTEKVGGIKEPVTDEDGCVLFDSVMVHYLELNVKTRQEGVRKVVNSGAPVRMSNIIESTLNKRSVVFKTLSLKEDNFESLHVDRKEFLPEDVATFGQDILAA